ncbi:MAG: phosphocholine cytidylyltransferase family protein [Candidatus Omnitrophica bacterium]|nr:phosphocholine cytidylyltransferase family protein [Candidatus Omnitrophota bacterium]
MKVILIAAGIGKRLLPMTRELPKCLAIATQGRTLFEEQLKVFRQCGIRDIVVVRGYQGDKFTRQDVRYVWNRDFERNNILGSLMKASAEFDDDLLISYSDIWFEPSIPAALTRASGEMVIAVDTNWREAYNGRSDHPVSEAETVEMAGGEYVRRIGKISRETGPVHAEFIGMLKLSRAGARQFKERYEEAYRNFAGRAFQRAAAFEKAYVTDMLQHLTDQGVRIKCHQVEGRWREIDTLQDFQNLAALWRQNKSSR